MPPGCGWSRSTRPATLITIMAYLLDGLCFTGDVAAVRFPGLPHVRVPTPPPEIDLPAWRRSLARLRELHPDRLLPTHFGPVEVDTYTHLQEVEDRLAAAAAFVRAFWQEGVSTETIIRPSSHGSPSKHWSTASTLTPLHASR